KAPGRIEDGFDPHLNHQIGLRELHRHQLSLLDADAMLARETAAKFDAEPQNCFARNFGFAGLVWIVGVVKDQRVKIAVASVENVRDLQAILSADLTDAGQRVRKLS